MARTEKTDGFPDAYRTTASLGDRCRRGASAAAKPGDLDQARAGSRKTLRL